MNTEELEKATKDTQELESLLASNKWQSIVSKGVPLARSLTMFWAANGEQVIVPVTISSLDEDRTDIAFSSVLTTAPSSNVVVFAVSQEPEWKRNDIIEAIRWLAEFSRENVDKTGELA